MRTGRDLGEAGQRRQQTERHRRRSGGLAGVRLGLPQPQRRMALPQAVTQGAVKKPAWAREAGAART